MSLLEFVRSACPENQWLAILGRDNAVGLYLPEERMLYLLYQSDDRLWGCSLDDTPQPEICPLPIPDMGMLLWIPLPMGLSTMPILSGAFHKWSVMRLEGVTQKEFPNLRWSIDRDSVLAVLPQSQAELRVWAAGTDRIEFDISELGVHAAQSAQDLKSTLLEAADAARDFERRLRQALQDIEYATAAPDKAEDIPLGLQDVVTEQVRLLFESDTATHVLVFYERGEFRLLVVDSDALPLQKSEPLTFFLHRVVTPDRTPPYITTYLGYVTPQEWEQMKQGMLTPPKLWALFPSVTYTREGVVKDA